MPQGSCYCLRLPPVGPTNQRPAFWVKMGESGIAVYLYTLNLPSLQFFSVWSSLVKPLWMQRFETPLLFGCLNPRTHHFTLRPKAERGRKWEEEQGIDEEGWGRWNLQRWRLMVAAISPLLLIVITIYQIIRVCFKNVNKN